MLIPLPLHCIRSLRVVWLLGLVLASFSVTFADLPVPARVAQPQTEVEAWNVIRLVEANLRRLLDEQRVDEVTDQVVLISPALRVLTREGALTHRQEDADEIATRAFSRVNLIVRESLAGNVEGAANVFQLLNSDLQNLRACFPPEVYGRELHTCVDHLELAEIETGRKCPDCGQALVPRRIPYSRVCVSSPEPIMRLLVKSAQPLRAGNPVRLDLALMDLTGRPVLGSELLRSHSERVHLLLADAGWTDFQHLAATPANEPGTYSALFVPRVASDYHLWVHIVPAETALPEFLTARLEGSKKREGAGLDAASNGIQEGVRLFAEQEGLVVQLVPAQAGPARFQVGRTQLVRLLISEAGGHPVRRLEPLWNAFAHVTMISPRAEAALLAHPVGADILNADLKGGPELAFKLRFPEAGIWRLFAQIRVDGKVRTFPLLVEVMPD